LFAVPDEKAETNRFSIDLPHLGSLILTHELNGEVKPILTRNLVAVGVLQTNLQADSTTIARFRDVAFGNLHLFG
jgi:cytochrome bd-type quinol oxidase subunit 1